MKIYSVGNGAVFNALNGIQVELLDSTSFLAICPLNNVRISFELITKCSLNNLTRFTKKIEYATCIQCDKV